MTDSPAHVVVVCEGNVCRSPVLERLLVARLEARLGPRRAGLVEVASLGSRARDGDPIDPLARAELERLGGDARGFSARRMTPEQLGNADLVLTATQRIRSEAVRLAPRLVRRAFTIRELTTVVASPRFPWPERAGVAALVAQAGAWRGTLGPQQLDVPDPMGRDETVHAEVAEMLDTSARVVAAALARALGAGEESVGSSSDTEGGRRDRGVSTGVE